MLTLMYLVSLHQNQNLFLLPFPLPLPSPQALTKKNTALAFIKPRFSQENVYYLQANQIGFS